MSAEVNVLPLHVLHLAGKVQIVHIRPMFLCGHADLAAALVHFVDDGVLRFQLVHAVGKRSLVPAGIQQIHHNSVLRLDPNGRENHFCPLEILILTRIQAGKGNGSSPGESEGFGRCVS